MGRHPKRTDSKPILKTSITSNSFTMYIARKGMA